MTKKQKDLIESVLGKDVVNEEQVIDKLGDPYLTPGSGIIMVRGDKICALCGKKDETRPYGPKGEEICYDCGMKNREVTERQMDRILFGETKQ